MQADRRDERGAIAVWVAVGLLGFFLAIGIGVDFAGHARTAQEARAVAREAARMGGQESAMMLDGPPALDRAAAVRAAERYIVDSGHDGTARLLDPVTVEATVRTAHDCSFLSLIGIWTLPVEETATAQLTPSYDGDHP